MKTISFCATALSCATTVLAQGTKTSAASVTTSSAAASCTASQITKICDYPSPGAAFAAAEDSVTSCWEYCNNHQPCDFVIWNPGDPNTGTGTCWLYPGQEFDETKASKNCSSPYLPVYGKPICSGGTPTSSGACTAAASPSPVAKVCDYPAPETCFSTCIASSGASHCLESCAKAESCAYAVFNPRNSDLSPYADGTCWVYTNGTFDSKLAKSCTGAPKQYVYNNLCPKPSPSMASSISAPASTALVAGAAATSPTAGPGVVQKNSAFTVGPAGFSIFGLLTVGMVALI